MTKTNSTETSNSGRHEQCLWSVIFSAVIAAFIYSGREVNDCIVVSFGIALIALAMYSICINCGFKPLPSSMAAIMISFCPYITELTTLNPALPLITAAGILAFSLWVRSLSFFSGNFSPSFILILLAPALWTIAFYLMANPNFMSMLDLKTFFPMPISEHPFPSFATFNASTYPNGFPVAVGYITLIFSVAGLYKLNFNAILTCITAAMFTIPALDKAIFQTPPGIWAIFPVLAISLLAANGMVNIAAFIENRFRIRPFWIMIIPVAEVLIISYIMTF